jgi:glucose uptake protein GlcU
MPHQFTWEHRSWDPTTTEAPVKIGTYAKAILGFVTPGLVVLGSALTDSSDGGSKITGTEWLTAAIAALVTGGAVYAKSNAPAPADDAGSADVMSVLLIVAVVIVVLALAYVLKVPVSR